MTKGKDALEMNTLTGSISGYPNQKTGEDISLSYSIPPAGSLLLFIPYSKISGYTIPIKPESFVNVTPSVPLKINRNEENVLMIDFCDLNIGSDSAKDLNTYYAADKVFKYYGFKNGNPWNTSVQFKRNITDRDTFKVPSGFSATYHFPVKGNSTFRPLKQLSNGQICGQSKLMGQK